MQTNLTEQATELADHLEYLAKVRRAAESDELAQAVIIEIGTLVWNNLDDVSAALRARMEAERG